ncbi:MFS transporter [Pseudomonas chlororaphis]|uniref:Transporter membrane protein n=1 Tax=Pseudomonas chlororaphis TaxID=587753 RepID=A0AAX3FSX4_9PSED|nr:MFS transporter [Pseudomonas chlororaphis]AZC38047.1 Transcription regulatory protein opdE [Pseudomonas chlororaphis subsp. piscium]AZC44593.1 Transcription regulatory protein opdE [Pseudomonas chlororaphis subsp. piscium]WDG70218.1 MFS transporter [Pseudomonas chlororaphis]WDH31996.1 MFS transporter [Pseudomonas chlororaphis]WDH68744.1 MFS transporter [Pseudomonas chlororaphis]
MTATFHAKTPEGRHTWGAVLAMALAAFALVASEFMPVSLLTPIAADLQVSEGQAGQGIAVSGLFALFTSLLIASVAARVDRKRLLLSLTLLMIVSGTLVAFAPDYLSFMAGRALIGVAIGGFWSLSAATTLRLVPENQVPRALAIVNGGNALATVIAAPLGSFLGSLIGWRGAFFCVVPVAAIAAVWLLVSLPPLKARPAAGTGNVFSLMKRMPVALGMLAVSLFFMGQFMLFTYLRPFLETVTQVQVSTLSLMLLVIGLAGLAGTFLIEAFLKNALYRTLIIIPLMMAAIAMALVAFGASVSITTVLLGLWGLVATAAPVAWWTWLTRTLPDDAEAGGGLMVAIIQLAIAAGATVGGLAFDRSGYQATFELSAALLVVAAVLALLAARAATRKSFRTSNVAA